MEELLFIYLHSLRINDNLYRVSVGEQLQPYGAMNDTVKLFGKYSMAPAFDVDLGFKVKHPPGLVIRSMDQYGGADDKQISIF